MVFGLAIIVLDGFSMVANHWSNDGMVTIHRYGLGKTNSDKSVTCIVNKYREIFFTGTPPKNKKIWKILVRWTYVDVVDWPRYT